MSPYRRPHGHGLTRPHGHRNRGQHRERGLARVYRGLPARGADDGLTLRLGSYGEQSDMRGQDAEVACPQGHLFRDPVVYPEVIGCSSRNGGSTEGVPYWRPHLRIEKDSTTGTSSSTPSSTSPGTEPRTGSRRAGGERTTRGWRRLRERPGAGALPWLAAAGPQCGEAGYQRAKSAERSSLRTRVRTCRRRWAPRGDHRICCFLTIRRLMTRLTAPSAVAVEIGSPQRWRSP